MKFIFSLFFTVSLSIVGHSQTSLEVVGSAGGYYQNPSGFNLHWTIGEVAVFNYQSEGFTLSQGFHQTYLNEYITDIWEREEEFSMNIFPNPTTNWVTIDSDYSEKLEAVFTSITGQEMLRSFVLDDNKTVINIEKLPAGIYLLSILNEEQLLKTYKLLKQ